VQERDESNMDLDNFEHEVLNESLSSVTHEISKVEAEHIVASLYGISGRAFTLSSERDQNFKIVAADGAEYIFKLSNAGEDFSIAQFQVEALLHIAQTDTHLPVPRVITALDGQTCLSIPFNTLDGNLIRTARLLSFLPGVPLHMVRRTVTQRRALATVLGQLGLALRDFSHAAAGHKLAWDIKNVGKLRELLSHIPSPSHRNLARYFFENFEENAAAHLPLLRAQVVHNDLNPYNVVVEARDQDRVAGIFDFGDMVYTSLINDVAIGACYHVSTGEHALEAAAEFVGAYHAVVPLEPIEVDLLFDLMAARFLATVAITGWRAVRYPQNSTYILRNNPSAWAGLENLNSLSREQAQSILRRACNME
jgi:hydroxylysine kinase